VDGRRLLHCALGHDEIVVAADQPDPHVGGKPDPGLLDMPGVTPEQVGRFYRLSRPGGSGSLIPLRVFVVQYGFDQECPNREFLEGDEVPGQDQIQLVNAVRRGRKLSQLVPPLFPPLYDCCHRSDSSRYGPRNRACLPNRPPHRRNPVLVATAGAIFCRVVSAVSRRWRLLSFAIAVSADTAAVAGGPMRPRASMTV
jgi:hypothetical protein